jgi:endoglucanase
MSFVTGYGTKSPKLPHHRPSTSDNIEDPIPGMLVGGPQPGGEDVGSAAEWKCADYRTGNAATAYTDQRCSYATNEVAINWNAPLAYLAGALEALNAGYAPSFAANGVARKSTVSSSSSSAVSSSSQVASSSSVAPASSSSESLASSSSQWNPWVSSSSMTTAIHETLPASMQNKAAPRLRQNGHKLYVEKNGKRFDLLGNSIR